MENLSPERNKINKSFFLGIIVLFAVFLVFSLGKFFTAFLASVMFYVLFKPWMEHLVKKKKWRKGLAAMFLILLSFFMILLPILFFGSMLYEKIAVLAYNPELILVYVRQLQDRLGVVILNEKNIAEAKAFAASTLPNVLNMGLSVFTSVIMMYFFLYFLLINFSKLEAFIVLALPFDRHNIMMFGNELQSQTFSNALGIPLIAVVQGALAFFIYRLTGLPEASFWGILTGFASIIPIVGTGVIWVPVCLFQFMNGQTWQAVTVLIWSALILGSMDNVIRFVLAKRMADVHPVVTVLGVIMGLDYMGITGLIFGPLLISYFIILVRIYYSKYRKGVDLQYQRKVVKPFQFPFFNRSSGSKS